MTGVTDFVAEMKQELTELHKLGVLSKAQVAKAFAYVDQNAAEYNDTRMWTDVTSAVDAVVMIVGECPGGRCG